MKSLITGITGFVGSHLAELLLKKRHEVYGTFRWRSRTEHIESMGKNINLVECDMTDAHSIYRALKIVKPDYIFHLAAQSFVPTSWKIPAQTMMTNVVGEVNLFEAIRDVGINPRIHLACSSEEYGLVYPNEIPIKEDNPLRPLSPYGVSKVAQDLLGYQYYKSYGMKIIRTRGFNHTGGRRGDVFVTSNFAKQIAEIESGLRKPIIYVGDLSTVRDFTDVRDMVKGYLLAIEKGTPGEVYNLCSGKGYKIKEVLDILLSFSDVKVKIKQSKARLRPSDVPVLIGDYNKFNKITGWTPKIKFEDTLKDILEYWRERIIELKKKKKDLYSKI